MQNRKIAAEVHGRVAPVEAARAYGHARTVGAVGAGLGVGTVMVELQAKAVGHVPFQIQAQGIVLAGRRIRGAAGTEIAVIEVLRVHQGTRHRTVRPRGMAGSEVVPGGQFAALRR